MYTTHHPCWDAKNRDNLAEELPFAFKEIVHCIPGQGAVATPVVQVVNPEAPKEVQQAIQTAPPEPPRADPTRAEPPKNEPVKTDLYERVPKALADLMRNNDVTVQEIQQSVANKGYYPQGTPIENYDPNFVSGVLVGAWPQVFKMIQDNRDIPF